MSFTKYSENLFYENKTLVLVLLYIITLGFYENYWHYKNWKIIKQNSGDLSISPILRGLFFPFFILSLISVLKGSAELAKLPQGVAKTSFGIMYIIVSLLSMSSNDLLYWFAFLFSLIPLYFLQRKASQINESLIEEVELPNSVLKEITPPVKKDRFIGLGVSKQFEYRSYNISNRYSIELSTVVIVLAVCSSVSMKHTEHAFAKAKLTEVLSSVSVLKAELGEVYALTGKWQIGDYDYVSGGYGSSIVSHISSSSDGGFHFELKEDKPFNQGDILSFTLKQPDYNGPMHINTWKCNGDNGSSGNRTTISTQFLPSICRG